MKFRNASPSNTRSALIDETRRSSFFPSYAERPTLEELLLLSMLLHVLAVVLLGDSSGETSQDGQRLWGATSFNFNATLKKNAAETPPVAKPPQQKSTPPTLPTSVPAPSITSAEAIASIAAPAPNLFPDVDTTFTPAEVLVTTPAANVAEAPANLPVVPAPALVAPKPPSLDTPRFLASEIPLSTPTFVVAPPPVEIPARQLREPSRAVAPPALTAPAVAALPLQLPTPTIAAPMPIPAAPTPIPAATLVAPKPPTLEAAPVEVQVAIPAAPVIALPAPAPAPASAPIPPALVRRVEPKIDVVPADVKAPDLKLPEIKQAEVKRAELPVLQPAAPAAVPTTPLNTAVTPSVPLITSAPTSTPAATPATATATTTTTTAKTAPAPVSPTTSGDIFGSALKDAGAAGSRTASPSPANGVKPMPKLDLDNLRNRARAIASEGGGPRTLLPFPVAPPVAVKKKVEEIFDKTLKRPDCRDAYRDMGLAAVVPLVRDAVTENGCKW